MEHKSMRKGTIQKFVGSWNSGIGGLLIQDSDTGVTELIPCENAPTVRALEACFGDVINNSHGVDNVKGGHVNQEIFWSYDEIGLILGGFTPVEDASEEIEEIYNKEL